mgnify:CR=1 FL=1
MASGKYFNKGVKALDSPHVGHVVRETDDKIVVFGGGDDRYDIPTSKIKFAAGNVLIDLPLYEIVKKYKVSRDEPLPASKKDPWTQAGNVDLDDLHWERQPYDPWVAYGRSKTANVRCAIGIDRRLRTAHGMTMGNTWNMPGTSRAVVSTFASWRCCTSRRMASRNISSPPQQT